MPTPSYPRLPDDPRKDTTAESGYARKWWVMTGAGLGTFVTSLNLSIINMSLPEIQAGLNATLATAEWVVLAYSLVMAVLLVTVGRLSDIFGRKKLFIAGSLLFGIGSILSGLAGHIYWLILSRVIQGVGGALIVANGTAIVTDAFPPRELGKALGILSSIIAIGTTLGPSLGGFILARADWPVIFFASAPFAFAGAILSAFSLRERTLRVTQRFDGAGAVILAGCLLTGLLGITYGQDSGWVSTGVIALFLISLACGTLFLRIELSTFQPILDMRLFRQRVITTALLGGFLYYVSTTANTFLSPFLLQRLFSLGAQTAGMVLMSVPLSIVLIAPVSGWLSDMMEPRVLASLGLAIGGVGFFWMSRLPSTTTIAAIIPPYVLLGIGGGLFQSPNISLLMGAVIPGQRGVAAGLLATARHMGMLSGIALAGAVWTGRSAYYASGSGLVTIEISYQGAALLAGLEDALVIAGIICFVAAALTWAGGHRMKLESDVFGTPVQE